MVVLHHRTLDSAGVGFPEKLHIIYLINDVVHHWYVNTQYSVLISLELHVSSSHGLWILPLLRITLLINS